MSQNGARYLVVFVAVAALLVGCGDDGDGSSTSGVVTETWSQYCVATLESDHEVIDPFGDPLFTARTGEAYLLEGFRLDFFDEDMAELIYLTPAGPIQFEIAVPTGSPFPFSSTCDQSASLTGYVGVFANTTIYSEVELSNSVCELTEGTVGMGGLNFTFASDNIFDTQAPYSVSFGTAFESQCPGVSEGFLRSGRHSLGGTQHSVLPLGSLSGP